MKQLYLLITIILATFLLSQKGNAQDLIWAKDIEASSITNIATDDSGNVYVTGIFGSYAIFDNQKINGSSINDEPNSVFFAKYDLFGKLKWVHTGVGTIDNKFNILINSKAEVYFGGQMVSGLTLENDTLPLCDFTLIKYDSEGNLLWAKCEDSLISIDFDDKENIVAVIDNGRYQRIIKYNSDGAIIMPAIPVPAPISGLVADKDGNFYITGSYVNTLTIGDTTLQSDAPLWFETAYIAKLDSTFKPVWAKGAKSTSVTEGISIVTDKKNNIYITGRNSNMTFENLSLNDGEYYIACFDTSGIIDWLKSCDNCNNSTSIMPDIYNNVYILEDSMYTYFDSVGTSHIVKWNKVIRNWNPNIEAIGMVPGKNGAIYIAGLSWDTISFNNINFISNPYGSYIAVLQDNSKKIINKIVLEGAYFPT